MRIMIITLALLLSACSLFTNDNPDSSNTDFSNSYVPKMSTVSVHQYSKQLAIDLLKEFNPIKSKSSIAIGTLVSIDSLSNITEKGPSKLLGLQIQESLTTAVTQLGFNVIEYKTLPRLY